MTKNLIHTYTLLVFLGPSYAYSCTCKADVAVYDICGPQKCAAQNLRNTSGTCNPTNSQMNFKYTWDVQCNYQPMGSDANSRSNPKSVCHRTLHCHEGTWSVKAWMPL
jgi:hypothetical protein